MAQRVPLIQEHQIPIYPSLEEFFQEYDAELAVLVSPVHFHTDMILTCLQHGANVLCEKPLCMTEEEMWLLDAAAQKANRFLAVGYQLDYRCDVLALKADILSGRFGAPIRFAVYHGFRRGKKYYSRNNWAGHILCNGREVFDSPFSNACAHHFQMLTFLLGNSMDSSCSIRSVQAELYRANPTIENYDIAAIRLHTEQEVSLLYYTAHPIQTEYWGPSGVLEFENATITYQGEKPVFRGRMKTGETFDYDKVVPGSDMQKLLDAIQAVHTGTPPFCSARADRAHIQAVRMVQQFPITQVGSERINCVETDDDRFFFVKDLEQILAECAKQWALPSELGFRLE